MCVGGGAEGVVADGDDAVVVGLLEPTGVVLGPVPACVVQLARTVAVTVAARQASILFMIASPSMQPAIAGFIFHRRSRGSLACQLAL